MFSVDGGVPAGHNEGMNGVLRWGVAGLLVLDAVMSHAAVGAQVRPVAPAPAFRKRVVEVAPPAVLAPVSFERYAIILQRMPFGDEAAQAAIDAAAAAQAAAAGPAAPPFTQNMKLCQITRNRFTDKIQAGIVDATTKKSYFLHEGESEDGMQLMVADYENERVLLKKGDEEQWLGLNETTTVPAAVVRTMPTITTARSSRVRGADPAPPPPPPKPVYTGEALEKHLKEYQLDLIRAGGEKGPPLPMELTPEMDQQLVNEGVLPPAE